MPKTLTDDEVLALFKSRWLTAAQVAQALGVLQDSVRKDINN